MKAFVIKSPGKGKTTCAICRQFYDKESRRTKVAYLGSFSAKSDPSRLPAGVKTRPGVVLEASNLADIQSWLLQNGTFGMPPAISPEVHALVRAQVLYELKGQMSSCHEAALDVAASVLSQAAIDVQAKAAGLRATGLELSKGFLGFTGVESASCASDLDTLKVQTNRIRAASTAFEAALKAARLMKQVNKSAKKFAIKLSVDLIPKTLNT